MLGGCSAGVLWTNDGEADVFWSYREQPAEREARDALTGETVAAGGTLRAERVYWLS